jgi:predicted ATPase
MAAVRDASPSSATSRAALWRIELLGQLRAVSGDRVVTQFGSRKVAALLARLALFPKRAHGREELIDLLWPEADLDTGRNRLRQTLFALRRLLEPPGAPEVLLVDRASVRLNADAFSCDAIEFEAHVRARDAAAAQALYVGELMPGFYDEWIDDERARLAALADRVADEDDDDGDGDARSPPPAPRRPASAAEPGAAGMHLQATESQRPDRQELLPAYVARFFGREAEMAQVGHMLQAHRLITLLGPGGSGKTRLAAEVARRHRHAYAVVAFVSLAECTRPDELPGRLRAALRLPDLHGEARGDAPSDAVAQLQLYLQGRATLLVLDNFEQLVAPGGAQVLEQLLQGLPELRMLVSSRRVLDVEGERSFDVPPLPLPAPDAHDDLATSAANPSVALFVDRAQGARAGFHLNARNRADIEALCIALEGVPLAIELAASRAHALSVAEMRAQMDERLGHPRFGALARKGPRAARAPRHASLDAAIDWSWQLLSPQDQRCLAALSVFREGFSADAAAAMWAGASAEPEAHDVLARLVSDSLVRSELGPDGTMRYHLFEMVREFVAERVAAPDRAALHARHRAWCLQLARSAMLPLADVPNLHEALRTSLADGEPLQALALALATESHWERRGVPPEVRTLWLAALDDLRSTASAPPAAEPAEVQAARCLFARRLYETGDVATAVVLADEAVAAARKDPLHLAPALAVQLRLRWKSRPRGDDGMTDALHRALAMTDDGSNPHTRAELLNLLGEVMVLGRHDAQGALPCYDQALALYESLGQTRLAWDVRMGQGICAQVQRRFDDAIVMHTAVARAAERLDDQLLLIDACNNLAVACNHARRWADAVRHGRMQLRLATRQYSRYMQVMALWNLARPLARSRQPEAAATALAVSVREWETHFGALARSDQRYVAKVRRLVRWQLGAATAAARWTEAQGMALGDAVVAVLEEGRVAVAVEAGATAASQRS